MAAQVAPLVSPTELPRWGVPSAFLSQFEPRPVDVQIVDAGALGVMTFAWRWAGEAAFSAEIASDAGASWMCNLDDAFAQLTFAAMSYVAGTTYRIDRAGNVTGAAGLTAQRYDCRVQACSSATAEAMTLMRDAVRPPLVSWSDDVRTHAGAMVYAILKRSVGATPALAGGDGDQNIFLAEEAARQFFDKIGRYGRPDGIVDTPLSVDGPLIARMPRGKTLRGW